MTNLITTADGRRIPDPRCTSAWRRLRAQVLREEPTCWLQLEGCTQVSDRGDHVVPVVDRPDLALVRSNVHGACDSCNRKRGTLPIDALRLGGDPSARPPALGVFD